MGSLQSGLAGTAGRQGGREARPCHCEHLFDVFPKLLSPVRPDWKKNGPTPAMAFLVTMGLECSFFDPIPTGCVLKSFSTISLYAVTGPASGLP